EHYDDGTGDDSRWRRASRHATADALPTARAGSDLGGALLPKILGRCWNTGAAWCVYQGMSTDVTAPALDPTHLPDDAGVLKQMVAEFLATVAQLRTTIDQQQAHIQYLVRLTFGRRSERVEGPTLFDLSSPAEEAVSAPPPEVPGPTLVAKRRGHGRRPRRADFPASAKGSASPRPRGPARAVGKPPSPSAPVVPHLPTSPP